MTTLKRVLTEPFVHFLILGALIFVLFGAADEGVADRSEDTIFVSTDRVELLQAQFRRVWRREPTAAETQGLIDDYIREEVLYREALALGLDQSDPVIRKRLRYKLEFLADSGAELMDPGDQVLRRFLEENADDYRVRPRIAFRQIYLGESPGQAEIERTMAAAAQIGPDLGHERLGQSTLLPASIGLAGPGEIDGAFGTGFFSALEDRPRGAWSGPVTSGFGKHLVQVTAREPGRRPELAEIREAVLRDWQAERAEEIRDMQFQTFRSRYTIETAETTGG
jgi:hypothetical protein